MSLRDRVRGAVYGHLLGDALGVPYEFRPPTTEVRWGARGTWGQPPGTWSDDGALMLALLDSLLDRGFDPEDQARRALNWYERSAYAPGIRFDVGNTTQAALRRFARGVPAIECGGAAESDNGTGSLMRVLPVALSAVIEDVSIADLVRMACDASSVTHRHPRSRACCALYALLVASALRGARPHMGFTLLVARPYLDAAELAELNLIEAFAERTGSGYVVDCLWSAWEAFDRSGSYEEAVTAAVRLGNDTDTTAAVAGGLAGAWYGVRSLPRAWLAGLRGREIVEPLVTGALRRRPLSPASRPATARRSGP